MQLEIEPGLGVSNRSKSPASDTAEIPRHRDVLRERRRRPERAPGAPHGGSWTATEEGERAGPVNNLQTATGDKMSNPGATDIGLRHVRTIVEPSEGGCVCKCVRDPLRSTASSSGLAYQDSLG